MCDVHTKAILNALLLTRFTTSPHMRCQFQATSSQRVVFQIPKDHCQHACLANKVVEKAIVEKPIVDEGLGKKCSQYMCFIFMVALDVASSFILFLKILSF